MTPSDPAFAALLSNLKKRSLASTLFNLAHAYSLSSNSAWTSLGATGNADFAAPAIMCRSFAIELLLKFFLVIDHPKAKTVVDLERAGVRLKEHKYTVLFDRLTPESRTKIAMSFTAISGRATVATGFREALVRLGDDPFVLWRYIYEGKAPTGPDGLIHLDHRLLDQVTDALGKAAEAEQRAARLSDGTDPRP